MRFMLAEVISWGAVASLGWAQPAALAASMRERQYCVLSVEEEPGELAILRPDGGRVAALPMGRRPHEVEVSPNGEKAYVTQFGIADYDNRVGSPGDRVIEVSLGTAKISGVFHLPVGSLGPHGVKLRPGTNELFVNTEVGGDRMSVFDVRTRRLIRYFSIPVGTHNFIFSRKGDVLFSFAGKGGVSKLNSDDGKLLGSIDAGSPVRGLILSRSGDLVASARGEILIIDVDAFHVKRHVVAPVNGQLVYPTELTNGDLAVPAMEDNGVVFFTGVSTRLVFTGKTPLFARQAPDGLIYVANVNDSYLTVLDAAGRPVSKITGISTPNGLAFAPCPKIP